jgi:hypothetical protein
MRNRLDGNAQAKLADGILPTDVMRPEDYEMMGSRFADDHLKSYNGASGYHHVTYGQYAFNALKQDHDMKEELDGQLKIKQGRHMRETILADFDTTKESKHTDDTRSFTDMDEYLEFIDRPYKDTQYLNAYTTSSIYDEPFALVRQSNF